jgi:hypothetical protein
MLSNPTIETLKGLKLHGMIEPLAPSTSVQFWSAGSVQFTSATHTTAHTAI